MKDIFENDIFLIWFPFNFWSFLLVFALIIGFFIYKIFFKNTKNLKENIALKKDFLKELEKIKNKENFLENIFLLYVDFLEEKFSKKNLLKKTFLEIKEYNFDKKYLDFYENIYFLKYKNIDISWIKKEKIYKDFENILKYN